MDIFQNQRVVDLTDLPPPPSRWPDPEGYSSFSQWISDLTDKKGDYRVKQVDVAKAAGRMPQAVTKWRNGGSIEVDSLVRLSEWIGAPFPLLRRLVDESKLSVLGSGIAESTGKYTVAGTSLVPSQFVKAWVKLDADGRRQVLSLAKYLAKHGKRPR